MTKLLKTNTVAENLELVKKCATSEEMTELLNTATVKMLFEFCEVLNIYVKKTYKKVEFVKKLVDRLFDEREAEEFKAMPIEEQVKKLFSCKSVLNILVKCDIEELKMLVKALKVNDEEVRDYFVSCPYINERDKYINLVFNKVEQSTDDNLSDEDVIKNVMSELENKTPLEKVEILENCSQEFLEDMCCAYGYRQNADKRVMAGLLAYSQKTVAEKIQSIKNIIPNVELSLEFFTDIGKQEQARGNARCLKRLQAWLKFFEALNYQQYNINC